MSGSVKSKGEAFEVQNKVLRLQQILDLFSKLNEAGNSHQYENTISELVEFLDSILDDALSDPDNAHEENAAFEVLSEIYNYTCSPSLDQAVVDVLSFELPKAVSKFAGLSNRILDIATNVIDQFIEKCGPRDMLSILCNVLGYSSKTFKPSSYVVPPLTGLSKAFISIRRRQFEQIKEAIPIILNVLKAVSLESDEAELEVVFDRAVEIASSIHSVCSKLEGGASEKLCALLGLYALQCTALVSASISYKASSCHSLLFKLSQISSYCGLSYLNLLTSYDVEAVTSFVFGDNKDDSMGCLSYVKHGAALSVIWGSTSEQVSRAAKEDLTAVKNELRSDRNKRWQAIGTLKHILSFVNLTWELKKHTINFLLCITDGCISRKHSDEHSEWPYYMTNLFSALQAVEMVVMYAPDTDVRKKAFDALKRLLADIPSPQRLDVLKALIKNTESSSMVAILMDLVRMEMHMEICNSTSAGDELTQINGKVCPRTFWSASVLELVELVLRPPQGGPPSLPEQSDAVLSALNLYRFALVAESNGKTNHTGAMSKSSLQKAYNEWLLPLRTLVTGIMTENTNDYDQLALDTLCTLNPLELVLYRCIELVEDKLKQSATA